MVSINDVLKASKGLPVDDIFAELWGRKLSGDYTIVTYTGTLPATLTGTKAGYLHRYKVYGNVGENLFDYRREFDGQATDTTYFRYYLLQLQPNTSYSIYSNAPSVTSTNETSFIITANEDPFNTATGGIWKNQAFTMTTKASGLVKVGLRKSRGTTSAIPLLTENDFAAGTYWLNLVKGSTVSDNYIPYEECGDRTENLFNPQDVAIGKFIASDGTEGTSSGTGNLTLNHSAMIAVSPLTAYTFYMSKSTANQAAQNAFCWFDENGTIITRDTFDVEYWETKITKTYQSPSNAAFLIINFRGTTDKFASGMIVEGSTAPTSYIPYGYKLPLLSGSTPVDIYIGDDTLSDTEYVDSGTGKIYRMVSGVLTPVDPPVPFPQIPTTAGSTTISWSGSGLAPSEVELTYERK